MVAYSVTLGDDDTFTIRDFGVYNLYHRAASMHIINTERLAQQMESKSTAFSSNFGISPLAEIGKKMIDLTSKL